MNITKEQADKVIAALDGITKHFGISRLHESTLADSTVRGNAHEAAKIMRGLAEDAVPVAYMHEGTLGRYFNENRSEVHSIPLYCAPMTHDSEFIQIPVAYQYAYPDGMWRCSYGDEINGSKPISSRALYAKKDGK